MKLCLIMMIGAGEADLLQSHLPAYIHAVDGFIALNNNNDAASLEVARAYNAQIIDHNWDWRFDTAQNRLIELAESAGYDAVLKSDPDECWFGAHIAQLRADLEHYLGVQTPWYNFFGDRCHYVPYPPFYPDHHMRIWRLGHGVRYERPRHSIPNRAALGWRDHHEVLVRGDIHCYHYGWTRATEYLNWRMANYRRTEQGLPPLPTGAPVPESERQYAPRETVPFVGLQPIHPITKEVIDLDRIR
ncbi:MAG: hypothetical protein WC683_14065 [bacterium]